MKNCRFKLDTVRIMYYCYHYTLLFSLSPFCCRWFIIINHKKTTFIIIVIISSIIAFLLLHVPGPTRRQRLKFGQFVCTAVGFERSEGLRNSFACLLSQSSRHLEKVNLSLANQQDSGAQHLSPYTISEDLRFHLCKHFSAHL